MSPRTAQKRRPQAPAPPSAPAAPRYSIDLGWYEAQEKSLTTLLVRCMCPKHQRRWSSAHTDRPPEEAIAAIKGCCSQEEDFLASSLPLAEAIFRTLLSEGNQPVSAEDIARRLAAWNTDQDRARDVSPPTIVRLLEHTESYGFRRVK